MVYTGDLAQLLHDSQRTGFTADCPKTPSKPAWAIRFAPETIYAVQDIVSQRKLCVGTKTGRMRCIDAGSGKVAWMWEGAGRVLNTPGVENGRVPFGSVNGVRGDERKVVPKAVYASNEKTGRLFWKFVDRKGFPTALLLVNKTVYIASGGGAPLRFLTGDGEGFWRFDAEAPILQSPSCVAVWGLWFSGARV